MDLPVQNPPFHSSLMSRPVHPLQTSGVFPMDRTQEMVDTMIPQEATPPRATVCVALNHQNCFMPHHYHFHHLLQEIQRKRKMNIIPIRQVLHLLISHQSMPLD